MTKLFCVYGITQRKAGFNMEVGTYCFRITAASEMEARGIATKTFMEQVAGDQWSIGSMQCDDISDFAREFVNA